MPKKKSKSKETTLGYWWNCFLFRKHFTFETQLSPAECANTLPPRDGLWANAWIKFRLKSELTNLPGDAYHFKIYAERGDPPTSQNAVYRSSRLPVYFETAYSEGVISRIPEDKTIVHGWAKTSVANEVAASIMIAIYLFLCSSLYFLPYFDDQKSQEGIALWGLLAMSILIIMLISYMVRWWRMYIDRNRIIQQLHEILLAEKVKNKHKLPVGKAKSHG